VNGGALYVLRYDGVSWIVEDVLTTTDAAPNDYLGGVAIGDGVIFGFANGDDSNLVDDGAGYVFRYSNETWSEEQRLVLSGQHDYSFGSALAIGTDVAVIGAYADDNPSLFDGSAFVFDLALSSPSAPQAVLGSANANRSIGLVPGNPGESTAIRVKLIDLQTPAPANAPQNPPPDYASYELWTCSAANESENCARWLGKPMIHPESQQNTDRGQFVGARLQCTPYYHEWGSLGTVHVFGAEIIPSSTYEIQAVSQACNAPDEGSVSAALTVTTARWGDVAIPFNPPSGAAQPDGLDVVALVNKFKNLSGAPSKTSGQIYGNAIELNLDVSGLDISAAVDAFKGLAYPYSGPCACPSSVTCNATPCATPASCSAGLCVKTCVGGVNLDQPCITDAHCPESTCGTGFCRDRCGRCN